MTTERELVEAFFGTNTTNDINDVVQHLVDIQTNANNPLNTDQVISELKSIETDITDWTI